MRLSWQRIKSDWLEITAPALLRITYMPVILSNMCLKMSFLWLFLVVFCYIKVGGKNSSLHNTVIQFKTDEELIIIDSNHQIFPWDCVPFIILDVIYLRLCSEKLLDDFIIVWIPITLWNSGAEAENKKSLFEDLLLAYTWSFISSVQKRAL